MPAVNDTMLVDAVDLTDSPLRTVRRAEVFTEHANFRVSHIFIFNSSGQLLLQRLAANRARNPGAWGSSVAAYLFASEDYAHAAHRRLMEELGIADIPLSLIGNTTMNDTGVTKFIGLFSGYYDGPFKMETGHIEALEFVPIDQINTMIAAGTRVFTPTFLEVFPFYKEKTSNILQ